MEDREDCKRCDDLEDLLKDANGRELVQLAKVEQLRSERDLMAKRIEELEGQLQDARRSRG